jgi:hypothetical protein
VLDGLKAHAGSEQQELNGDQVLGTLLGSRGEQAMPCEAPDVAKHVRSPESIPKPISAIEQARRRSSSPPSPSAS